MNDLTQARDEIRSWLDAIPLPLPPAAACELLNVRTESRSLGWADGRPSVQGHSATSGFAVRYLENGSQSLVTAADVDAPRVAELVSRARAISAVSPRDPHRRFAPPAAAAPPVPVDERLFLTPSGDMISSFRELEKAVLAIDSRIKKVVKFSYSEERRQTALANSLSVALSDQSSQAAFVVEILAEHNGETEVAWDFVSRRFSSDVDKAKVADRVARHALASLGGRPVASGRYPVVVHPRVGTQLLSLVSEALSAEAVQLGRSFFVNKRGAAVASAVVTLVDDPLLPRGTESGSFDDEGTPHRTMSSVEKGILTAYFYDLRSATRDGVESNGHGLKESLALAPSPHSTNFFMSPGSAGNEAMLAAEPSVLYLLDVMGLHMADPITGEFSLGASGYLYEKGVFARSVRGVTIAGTVQDVLRDVTAVGGDLTWYGGIGAPTFLVSSMAVSGH